jgi:hypothetical protein
MSGRVPVGRAHAIMTYNLAVWKWRTGVARPRVDDVLEEIYKDDAHPAMTRFDRRLFEIALRDAFGDIDSDESPFQWEMADFYGLPANWALFCVSWSRIEDVFPRLVEICRSQGLTMYDYESAQVAYDCESEKVTKDKKPWWKFW